MEKYLTTKDVASLLNINEKRVYSLATSGKIPGTLITGKWLFSEKLINDHLKRISMSNLELIPPSERQSNCILMAGSDDPTLSFIKQLYYSTSKNLIYSASIGSSAGMELLRNNECDIAISHIQSDTIPDNCVTINLFNRNVGYISGTQSIHDFSTIAKNNMRFINRQKGAGIRVLIDKMLSQEGIDAKDIIGYENEVSTHIEIASKIKSGQADVGVGVEFAAKMFNLFFTPVKEEKFFIIINKDYYFDSSIQQLLNLFKSGSFSQYYENLPGYNITQSGIII
ncbi:MAG: hypothetical protein A2015_10370 [Spirochaetes bacterium GWF1_31_7]|nr:MAG: hypothetical protein A2Y30_16105 [Spirochaetes bacterium GWE1_32_154]OHD48504.1 MAG: hypothetical protein A2Y29_14080 [Spirochaetes bacterium GWE2_31_10]OHD51418.1 MAG: hypothetical protein A2015_10370 [Spirochaetes bacterium GWF1_31_7]OHD79945.1 MAG: hypothetical protein A2355_12895 [Spirochaetes bacterium RIFOXYB1_FULL_32_8]HBD93376.1 hypothetical protein [Spirochaetia bacterium]